MSITMALLLKNFSGEHAPPKRTVVISLCKDDSKHFIKI